MLRNKGGQTVIELVVVLPVFMMIIFVVLELGNIAYHTLIAHHISYELARVGSMVGVKKHSGKTNYTDNNQKHKQIFNCVLAFVIFDIFYGFIKSQVHFCDIFHTSSNFFFKFYLRIKLIH